MEHEDPSFVAIDEWIHSDLLAFIWNESVAHFAPIGVLQQLILQRPYENGPLLIEATASKSMTPPKTLPRSQPGLRISGMWLKGESAGDTRERLVAFPWNPPVPHFNLGVGRIEKSILERIHFDRFTSDVLLASGTFLYDGEIHNGDRPDIVVEGKQGRIGIDCCQFIDEESKAISMLFNLLKEELMKDEPSTFKSIHGASIMLLLGDENGPVKPPRRSEVNRVAREIANELKTFVPKFVQLEPGQPLPEKIDIDIRTSPSGIRYFANPGIMAESDFQRIMGFDITFDYSAIRTTSNGWDIVRKLIRDHDSENFNHPLVSIGAPDRDGSISPNEAVWFSEIIRFPESVDPPEHLSKVYFHNWSSGQTHEINWDDNPSGMVKERHGPVRHE